MRDHDVGALPVCDGERLIGMLTDRDIAIRAVAEGRDPRSTRARDVITEKVRYVFEDQDVQEAARMMEEAQIRRLPVLNRDKKLVGVLSLGDLAVRFHDEDLSGEALEQISQPAR
jgi:CBS domain-containing protein